MESTTATTPSRDEVIRIIRTNLRKRGLTWVSVTGGHGTAWGWITIKATPSNGADKSGSLTEEQQAALAAALGLGSVHRQGEDIPASDAYRTEYIARSAGQAPEKCGTQYWD